MRNPKPWLWKARKTWCVYINGKKHVLGPDKKEAKTKFHNLMGAVEAPQPVAKDSVQAVLDGFLTWTLENRSPKTYRGYKDFCQSFTHSHGARPINRLSTAHVTDWLNGQKTWNATTKRNAVTCLMRGFNWAVKDRGLLRNPIYGMEKPEAKTRTDTLTLSEFKQILRNTHDREFRDLLRFSADTGCRPQEAKRLEARHVQLDKCRCVFPADEAKKKRTRVIYMNNKALVIVRRVMKPGILFLNRRGRPWTARAVKCRFERLEKKLGRRYTQYMFRHTWVTDKLRAGVDSHVVGLLSGHADTKMIDQVYSHVAEDQAFMLAAARKKPAGVST